MNAPDAKPKLPQSSMKKSIKSAIKGIGRVASFHTGEDMLPLEDLMKTGDLRTVKKLPVSISKLLKGISKVASFHPGEDFQVLKGCKTQKKGT